MVTNQSEFVIYNIDDNVYIGNKFDKTESLLLEPNAENTLKFQLETNKYIIP